MLVPSRTRPRKPLNILHYTGQSFSQKATVQRLRNRGTSRRGTENTTFPTSKLRSQPTLRPPTPSLGLSDFPCRNQRPVLANFKPLETWVTLPKCFR